VRHAGREVIDDEIAFCAALLHDLGLVPAYAAGARSNGSCPLKGACCLARACA
jgi:hypothetical protein